jgi:hypothetical protein
VNDEGIKKGERKAENEENEEGRRRIRKEGRREKKVKAKSHVILSVKL